MNIDELRNLKRKLESKKEKYVVVNHINNILSPTSDARTLNEFKKIENTEEVVEKCEKLIENTVRFLSRNEIAYNQIELSSIPGFLCKIDYVKSLNFNNKNKSEIIIEAITNANLKAHGKQRVDFDFINLEELKDNVSDTYIPIEFFLSYKGTGIDDINIKDYQECFGYKKSYDDILKERVSGIVNLEKFIMEIRNLGYDIGISSSIYLLTMDDYIKSVMEDSEELLNITVDFRKEKVMTRNNMRW